MMAGAKTLDGRLRDWCLAAMSITPSVGSKAPAQLLVSLEV